MEIGNVPKINKFTYVLFVNALILHKLGANPKLVDALEEMLHMNFWENLSIEVNVFPLFRTHLC